MNANMMIESEMLTSTLEREMRKLIMKAQKEVLEVCAKEYNFDINAAMLLVNAGVDRKVVKERKAVKEKKERAKKAVKELVEGEVEGDLLPVVRAQARQLRVGEEERLPREGRLHLAV